MNKAIDTLRGLPVRLLIATVGPLLIASLLTVLLGVVETDYDGMSFRDVVEQFVSFSFFASLFAGIQSILFAVIIEFVIPKFSSNQLISVAFGAFFGYATGLSVIYFLSEELVFYSGLGALGALTGVLVSYVVVRLRGAATEENILGKRFSGWRPRRPFFLASLALGIASLAIVNPWPEGGVVLLTGPVYLFVFTAPWYVAIRLGLLVYRRLWGEKSDA